MKILGIGNDVTSIKRFEKHLKNQRFIKRILTEKEQDLFYEALESKKANFLAKRFAGKEAFSKALGVGIGGKFKNIVITFHSIEILKEINGRPFIKIMDKNLIKYVSSPFIAFSDENDLIFCNILLCSWVFYKTHEETALTNLIYASIWKHMQKLFKVKF